MKKALQLIFFFVGLTSCNSQEVSGIWMSYNNRVIEKGKVTTSRDEGIIIDFDKQTIDYIVFDTIIDLNIDYENSKIFYGTKNQNIDFKVYRKDSIEIDLGQNEMHVFRPLNLKHKLAANKNDIIEFLSQNEFQQINENLNLKFKKELHFFAKIFARKNDKRFLESQIDTNGYWFIKELKGNFFLVFAVEEVGEQNIYQITKLTKCKMDLEPLQEYGEWINNLTELKTCL